MVDKEPEVLGISVHDEVKTKEVFGDIQKMIKRDGIAGTLQCSKQADCHRIMDAAWKLSEGTGKPVVIVVRAT